MKVFIRYFGGKWSLARHYGRPRRPVVVEPFAGGAGYATFWDCPKVILVEKCARTARIWQWLIRECTPADMLDLDPELTDVTAAPYPDHVKDFIATWFGRGSHGRPQWVMPPANRKEKSKRDMRFWGERVQRRIAAQLPLIKNWEIVHGDYAEAPDIDAHWHIDPPYVQQGNQYPHGSKGIDYAALAQWCRSRRGSGEVCEAAGADWLPFRPLRRNTAQSGKKYTEMVWRLP